jgi:flagellar biosynthesis/type III secretory pathway M-ring protein FliF/YscJ
MDFVKQQFDKIREQLAGLNASQRMLAGALAVIMVMTLLWWSKYAGTSEMEDLLGQDFSAEEVTRVSGLLDQRGIPRKVNGARVQVPADRRTEALALLTYEGVGPTDTSAGFDDIIAKMDSPWNTDVKQNEMFKRAKEAVLAQVMRAWPGVRDAQVILDLKQKRAFGEADSAPSATVNLRMKGTGEKPGKRLIQAAADAIAGAVSGMNRSRVTVIVDGASHTVGDKEEGGVGGDSWMDLVKEGERHFAQKIQDHLRYIDGVMVSVTVDPNMKSLQQEKETYDKEKTLTLLAESTERTDESTTTSRPPGEPGVVPNTGAGANQPLSVGGSSGGGGGATVAGGGEGSTTNTNENKTKNQIFPSVVREWIRSPAGASAVVGASVSIPRSHLLKIYKAAFPNAKEPDDATLQPLIDKELARVKDNVLGCVSQTPDDKVKVDWYYDYLPAGGDAAGQVAVAASVPLAITGHLKEIALGALAVVSLFMVSMMVRKATPAPIIPPMPEKPAKPAFTPPEEPVAEATEGLQEMDGIEVDTDSVRNQQIISQVSSMVKENPDAAANLVKRWLSRA